MRKVIYEQTMFKLLVERTGILFSVTLKSRAYFFFLCSKLIAIRTAPTTDPYPGIVEVCGYDIRRIVESWRRIWNIKLVEGIDR
ncbi:MAG TPA: hypothetical protein VJN71_00605 [Nitrososphaerales archaeon]|nr:hypothetical protein [Nitrososphaerales archaeon]